MIQAGNQSNGNLVPKKVIWFLKKIVFKSKITFWLISPLSAIEKYNPISFDHFLELLWIE